MIGAITIIGDLVESMFKRDAGVKDSGIIIPGHGGILDKLDGALFAGPVLFWLIITIKVIRIRDETHNNSWFNRFSGEKCP